MGNVSFFQLICNNLAQRCTHTHTSGGRGGGREQGQPATTNNGETKGQNNKGRKQAREHTTRRQNKGRKTGWHAEEQSAQSKTGNKAKPQQRENWSRTAQGRNNHTSKVWAGGRGVCSRSLFVKTQKARWLSSPTAIDLQVVLEEIYTWWNWTENMRQGHECRTLWL